MPFYSPISRSFFSLAHIIFDFFRRRYEASVAIIVCKVNASALASVSYSDTEATGVVTVIVIISAVKALVTASGNFRMSASRAIVSVSFIDNFTAFAACYVWHNDSPL